MADALVLPFAERLLGCLCSALALTDAGGVCQCCLRPGGAPPPADACCNCGQGQGQASVQVTRIYPVVAGKFPQAGAAGALAQCDSFEWAAELTMTVYRCVSVADEEGFPSCDELTSDTAKIMDDAGAMRRAILCCDWRADELGGVLPIVLGDWRPVTPQGGCAGGQQSVTVLVGPECCPAPVL